MSGTKIVMLTMLTIDLSIYTHSWVMAWIR